MQSLRNHRPLSPHLQIYKLPLVSIMSIAHRMTGIMLFVFLLLVWVSFTTPYRYCLGSILSNSLFLLIWNTLFFASFSFHLLTGIRHLLWNKGLFLSLKAVFFSNITILIMTISLIMLFLLFFQDFFKELMFVYFAT